MVRSARQQKASSRPSRRLTGSELKFSPDTSALSAEKILHEVRTSALLLGGNCECQVSAAAESQQEAQQAADWVQAKVLPKNERPQLRLNSTQLPGSLDNPEQMRVLSR